MGHLCNRSQDISKAVVSQVHPLHTEVTPLRTPCSSPCTSLSSQQGNWGSQSTPEPNPRGEHPSSKQSVRRVPSSVCMDNTTHSQAARMTLPCLASTGNRLKAWAWSLDSDHGKTESALTTRAIYFALCWNWDSWPKPLSVMLFPWKPVLETKHTQTLSHQSLQPPLAHLRTGPNFKISLRTIQVLFLFPLSFLCFCSSIFATFFPWANYNGSLITNFCYMDL